MERIASRVEERRREIFSCRRGSIMHAGKLSSTEYAGKEMHAARGKQIAKQNRDGTA
jgi:hypothetical protein